MSRAHDGPYADSLAAAVSAALIAGLLATAIDVAVAGDAGPTPQIAGLWALPLLAYGALAGLVAGAFRATFGDGALRRLHRRLLEDRAEDVRLSAAILAGMAAALILVAVVAAGAGALVAGVQRTGVGALLLGVVVVLALPLVALLALPIYRVTRHVAPAVPSVGPLPASLVIAGGGAVAAVVAGLFVLFTRLDWRALDLTPYAMLAGCALFVPAWVALARGPMSSVRTRIPARGRITAVAAAVAVLLPLVTLRGQPDPETALAITQETAGARFLVDATRGVVDGDGDGFSPFFAGPDCDDGDPAVHPDADEVPGNGIDDNCVGGDRAPRTASGPAPRPPRPDAPDIETDGNLLVILVDTLRADRLGASGYRVGGASLTPNIDALAERGTWFRRAYSQSPNTPRALPSMLASRYPSQIAVGPGPSDFPKVLDRNLLLFELLQAAGLRTVGFASHFYFAPERNVTQGFDRFDNAGARSITDSQSDVAAPRIVPRALAELEELAADETRFAMFVHLFEPHASYVVHDESASIDRGVAGMKQKYDQEIAFVDRWVGRLLDALVTQGLDENTTVVLLSDHGEAFGDHELAGQTMYFHGQTLYDELLHVPLIIRVPGARPRRVDTPVGLVDLAPTVLDLFGIDRPRPMVGRSLEPAIAGAKLPPWPVFAELLPSPSWDHNAYAMVSGDGAHKLIYVASEGRWEQYDLAADPGETRDVHGDDPAVTEALETRLLDWIEVELRE